MKDSEKLTILIEKLDNYIHHLDDVKSSNTSPTHRGNAQPDSTPAVHIPHISDNIDLTNMTKEQLILTHSQLHMLYPRGSKTLTKEGIEKLHEEVKNKLNHFEFDQLDRK
jgi:hypothetical protein